jgi:hypothetical protein
MEMKRTSFVTLAVVTLVVFVASSTWYNPLLFGRKFLELSGAGANAHPSPMNALFEVLRTFVLTFVIAHLLRRLEVADWRQAIGLGLWLWVGFPVVLLTGSILWQNVPWQLAAIHSGDWLIKLILIPVGITIWPKRAPAQPH